jgi:hypothetical protein
MTEKVTGEQTTSGVEAGQANDAAPAVDPGGAHNKGYGADPGPDETGQEPDPVPLAPGPNTHSAVRVPERDNHVRPTGRKEPPDDAPIEI